MDNPLFVGFLVLMILSWLFRQTDDQKGQNGWATTVIKGDVAVISIHCTLLLLVLPLFARAHWPVWPLTRRVTRTHHLDFETE
jgi:hypothetical protein